MRVHCLQHVPFEGPAAVEGWAGSNGHRLTLTRLFADEPLPEVRDVDRLVVLGGPMNVYEEDRHPWLRREKAFLREAIEAGRSVLGVCLGAQLIADALGARVFPARRKEIGWFPVEWTEGAFQCGLLDPGEASLPVFHWHGDTFDLPNGAVHLARSRECENQAFLHGGRVLALQFHLESTEESIRRLVATCRDEIDPGPSVQTAEAMHRPDPENLRRIHRLLFTVLDRLPV